MGRSYHAPVPVLVRRALDRIHLERVTPSGLKRKKFYKEARRRGGIEV
jgi:hypothetical protein